MEQTEVYLVIYGCHYEFDAVLGVYTSYYYAKKAKKEYMESKQYEECDYARIEPYTLNASLIIPDEEV